MGKMINFIHRNKLIQKQAHVHDDKGRHTSQKKVGAARRAWTI
jgi:hypothetical protein